MIKPLTIIGFSGPPRAGKDSAMKASLLFFEKRNQLFHVERMSRPLKEAAIALFPDKSFCREEKKDEVEPTLNKSFRQVQIDLFFWGAERFGTDWLGKNMAKRLEFLSLYSERQRRPAPVILCPDFGRKEEVEVLIASGHRVHQLQIFRDGTTYEGDSREPFLIPGGKIITNSGPLFELQSKVESVLSSLFPSDQPYSF